MKSIENSSRKHDRVLEIYNRLLSGEILIKEELAEEFGVGEKSIQRDIDALRDFCFNRSVSDGEEMEITYDRIAKGYRLKNYRSISLTNAELFTVVKILLESRALNKAEMTDIVDKIVEACIPPKEQKKMKGLTKNELFHYVEPRHQKALIENVWNIGTAVYAHKIIHLEYQKTNGEITNKLIKPVGIMCSEYYFYLIAYPGDADKKHSGYPTVYRIDRIKSYRIKEDGFDIPYADRFEEGEFRKRIPFMWTGKLKTERFIYKGRDINAVLDRLPTAVAKLQKDGTWKVTAEVFGKVGFQMWARGQGDVIYECTL